jgi:DNA replication protein DnaC
MISDQIKAHLHQLAPYSNLEKPLETYDHIELDAEDLRQARQMKHERLEREKYLASVQLMKPAVKHTAEEYYKAFTEFFPIDKVKEEAYYKIVTRLCCYFANDRRFETSDLKLDKGILLFGGVGVGKTTLMQMFRQNQAFSYRLVSCREVESEFAIDGDAAVKMFSVNTPIPSVNKFHQTEVGFCFDDLGTENAITKHFGNAKNVLADILLNRYDLKLDKRSTHITTNLNVDEIEKHYGTRVIDRIRENFNLILFDHQALSRR